MPAAYQGDVMGDLNARRGRVQGTEAVGDGEQEVTALVPTSEIMRYAIDLRSLTGGRGRFTATHDHYDPMPSHLVDKVAKPRPRRTERPLARRCRGRGALVRAPPPGGRHGRAANRLERALGDPLACDAGGPDPRRHDAAPRRRAAPEPGVRSDRRGGCVCQRARRRDRHLRLPRLDRRSRRIAAIEVLRAGIAEAGGLVRQAEALTGD